MDVKTLDYLRKGKREDIPYKLDCIARNRVHHRNRAHTELMLKQAQQYEEEKSVTLIDTEKSKRHLHKRMRILRHQKRENTKTHSDEALNSVEESDDYHDNQINGHASTDNELFLTERSRTTNNLFGGSDKVNNRQMSSSRISQQDGKKTEKSFIKYPRFEVVEPPRFFISPPNLTTIGSIRRPKRGDSMQEENASRVLLRALTDLDIVHRKNQKVELENARLISEMETKMGVKLNTPRRRKPNKKAPTTPRSRDRNQSPHSGEVIVGLYPERMKEELGFQAHDEVKLAHFTNNAPSMPAHSRLSQPVTSSVDLSASDLWEGKPQTAPDGINEDLDLTNEGKARNPNLRRSISKQTLEFPEIPIDQQRKALGGTPRGESVTKMNPAIKCKEPRKLPDLSASKDTEASIQATVKDGAAAKNPKLVSLPKVNIFMEVIDNPFATNAATPITRSRDLVDSKRDGAMHEWLGMEEEQLEGLKKVKKTTLSNGDVIEEVTEDDPKNKEENEERLSDVSSGESEDSHAEEDDDERFQIFKEKVIKKSKQKSTLESEKEATLTRAEKEHKRFIKSKLCSVLKAVLTVSYFWMIPPGDRVMSKSPTTSVKAKPTGSNQSVKSESKD